jgi:hypothetical protein
MQVFSVLGSDFSQFMQHYQVKAGIVLQQIYCLGNFPTLLPGLRLIIYSDEFLCQHNLRRKGFARNPPLCH